MLPRPPAEKLQNFFGVFLQFQIGIDTIEEASKYFRIGENKLRKLAEDNPTSGWVILNGNRIQIKRKQFEKVIDTLDAI